MKRIAKAALLASGLSGAWMVASATAEAAACKGIGGRYNGAASTIMVTGNRVAVTMGRKRPIALGTCSGNRIMVNFTDDRIVSGVSNGRIIAWDNRTTWRRD